MFENLKKKNERTSVFKNSGPLDDNYCKSPGATSSVVKGNEADRLVRCQVCGFICDKERDVKMPENTYAGMGIKYSAQKTASASIGDSRTPSAGRISTSPDKYYTRDISGGCPCCGSYLYDRKPMQTPP